MTCTITSRGFELLLALQIAPPERFPKNALSILKCNLLEILCALVERDIQTSMSTAHTVSRSGRRR